MDESVPYRVVFRNILDDGICARCKKEERTQRGLKRCAGCRTAMYCSRDCQKNDWPSHKSLCRGSVDIKTQSSEEHPSKAIAYAFKKWGNIHRVAISTLILTVARIYGGATRILKDEEGVLVRLRFRVSENPATALEIVSLSVLNKHARHEPIFVQWEPEQKAYRDSIEASRARRNTNPKQAGTLPVTYVVEGTDLVMHSQETIYHPNLHASDYPLDEFNAMVHKDILSLCTRCLNTGLILESSYTTDRAVPDAGYLVHQRKDWVVKRSENPGALMSALMKPDDHTPRFGLTVQGLWSCWRVW